MTGPDETLISALNDELLESTGPAEENEPQDKEPKRNTKDAIIQKIIETAETHNITIEHSNTKLRRMTKTQLNKLLAETIELGMRAQMAEQVGVQKNASERLIALGALRMVHNLCANAAEQGLNVFLPTYGYEVSGFANTLERPPVKEAVDACLEEIARESDILGYIESPYARLGIAWSGAIVSSLKRKENKPYRQQNNAPFVGSKPPRHKNPLQPRASRGPPPRKEQRGFLPPNVHEV